MHDDQPTLLAIIVTESEKTQEEIVDGFMRCAQEHGEDAALSLRTLRRWMVGDVQTQPRPAQRRVARIFWGHPMHELLAPPKRETTIPQHIEPATVPDRADAPLSTITLERQISMSARRAARAWAQLGAADEARTALARAAGHRERLQGDDIDEIGGLFAFPQAKQHYYAAGTYVYLDGLQADAAREATQALQLYETGDAENRAFADEAGTRAELALARIHEGQLDGARDALDPVLDYGPELRVGGIVASVGRVHAALRGRQHQDSTIARGMRDEIESFSQRPAAALTA